HAGLRRRGAAGQRRHEHGGMAPPVRRTLLLVVLVLAGCGGSSRSTFTNPVLNRDFPDPFVLKVGDTYYAYATNGNGKQVQTLTSKDLVHWSPGPDALPQVGPWSFPGNTWAPEA